jgi:predicted O-linked N-acetylglucosamine transferase (SPINDLY family)
VTFGSFNDLAKLSEQAIALWARILLAVPASTLIIKAKALGEPTTRTRLEAAFAAQGIGPERLTLEGHTPSVQDHLAGYRRVDIALDTFPITGATTTAEALWMGVPVITLAGPCMAQRQSAAMLAALGRQEWVANSEEDYLTKVVALAQDPDLRRRLRGEQRELMAASELCDATGMANALESAYRQMWADLPGVEAGANVCYDPDEARQALQLARQLHRAGRSPEAEPLCRRALELQPYNAQAHNLAGLIAAGVQDYAQAAACFRQAIQIDGSDAGFHNNLANALLRLGQPQEAAQHYRQVLNRDPQFLMARHNLAIALWDQGRPAEAIHYFRQVVAAAPRLASALRGLAGALFDQGKIPEATDALQRLIDTIGGDIKYYSTYLFWIARLGLLDRKSVV